MKNIHCAGPSIPSNPNQSQPDSRNLLPFNRLKPLLCALRILFFAFILLIAQLVPSTRDCSLLFAQQPTQEWVRRYSGVSLNGSTGRSIKLDSAGNVYVLTPVSTDTTYGDYCVIKYTPLGTFLWQAIYNSPGNLDDGETSFSVTGGGDVYVTGSSGINFVYHVLTVKFNSNGIFQWARNYNGGGPADGAIDIAIDKQGNIIITGGSAVDNNIVYALTVKYNSNGDSLWVRKFTQYEYSYNNKLVVDDSSNIYTTGYHRVNIMQDNYLSLKYDRDGNLKWFLSYGLPPVGGISTCIAIDSNRNVYIAGNMYTLNPGYSDNALVKINQNGDTVWTRIYTGIGGNHNCSYTPTGLSTSLNGNAIYYTTASVNQNSPEFITLAYNSTGDSIWVRRYPIGGGGMPQNNPADLKLDRNNNIYVIGNSVFLNNGVIVKYNNSGVQQWVATGDSSSCKSIFIDSNFNFYVTGAGRFNNVFSAVTIKFNQPIGIISKNSELPRQFKLNQNWPNPFNSSTVINYEIPYRTIVEMKLYNSLGQLIKALVSGEKSPGYYTVILNLEYIPSGVYFYSLRANNYVIATKKLIIVK